MKKVSYFFSIFLLLIFFFISCDFSLIEKNRTSSIIINFGSANHSRAASYTKSDLSYFIVSIAPKVHPDIKIDFAKGETKAEFVELEEGSYKISVSAFNSTDTKTAYGESELVDVIAGETTTVPITMKFLKSDDEVTVPDTEANTPDDDTELPGDDSNTPDDDTELTDNDTDTPDDNTELPGDDSDTPDDNTELPDDGSDTPDDNTELPDDGSDTPGDNIELPGDGSDTPGDNTELPGGDSNTPDNNDEHPDDPAPAIPDIFVEVSGIAITGTETWTPGSTVFVSGRQFTIPDLLVSNHEVTRSEFKSVMEIDPSTAGAYDKNGNELTGEAALNNPVNYVNWYDAIAYCNKLSIKEGLTPCYSVSDVTDWASLEYSSIPSSNSAIWNNATCDFNANGYRLPTEAEWEWLARGGENYKYAGSDSPDDVAWHNENTSETGTRTVKIKSPNSYGLYDMSGNVAEWCWDWQSSITSSTNAYGATSGTYRISKGGSWYDFTHGDFDPVTVYDSNYFRPDSRCDDGGNSYYGFRVVRTNSTIESTDPVDTFNWYESPVDADTGLPATSSSTTVLFGVFPKSVVPETSSDVIRESITKTIGGNTYYGDDEGNWYAKVIENSDTTSCDYSDGSSANQYSVTAPSTRYFKVEPIRWKVITPDYNSTGKALLVADNVLIGNIPFYENKAERTINETTVYINNYKYSTIRAYLNGKYEAGDTQTDVYTNKGFLQTAFTSTAQSLIADTVVDNSTSTTGYDSSSYATYTCDNTTDKIFLLSESEVVNTSYGFDPYNSVSSAANHTTRQRIPTDFAQANNVYQSSTTKAGYWWVRSPYGSSKESARAVTFNGALNGLSSADTMHYGVVPALTISF